MPYTLMQARAESLRERPSSPLITDCTQGRVELSRTTFDNWVCKTVNLLRLELDVEPGQVVHLELPLHWMTAVWLVSVWESGADVSLDTTHADLLVGTSAGADVLVVPDALGMAPAPSGVDVQAVFPADARGMPDQLVFPAPQPGGMAGGPNAPELAQQALDHAQRWGLEPGGRLATDLEVIDIIGALASIASPLSVRAGVIYGTDVDQERPTVRATR